MVTQSRLISLQYKGCDASFPPFPPFFSEAFGAGGDGEEGGGGHCQVDGTGVFGCLVWRRSPIDLQVRSTTEESVSHRDEPDHPRHLVACGTPIDKKLSMPRRLRWWCRGRGRGCAC